MKTRNTKFNQILLGSTSAFLAFWLSSVLVLVCCSSHLLVASAMNMDESCPMQKEHDCCEKESGKNKISETEKDKADCCVFKPQKTLSGDLKNQQNVKQAEVISEKIFAPKPVYFIKKSYQPLKVYHSTIRNRGSTYLQNCVFRI